MTIEEALGPGPWYGQPRVAYLNDAGDLVLMKRHRKLIIEDLDLDDEDAIDIDWWPVETVRWIVDSIEVVSGTDAEKINALRKFERRLAAA